MHLVNIDVNDTTVDEQSNLTWRSMERQVLGTTIRDKESYVIPRKLEKWSFDRVSNLKIVCASQMCSCEFKI